MSKTDSTPEAKTTVTVDEILAAAGIERRTFNRWMAAGLVPRPQMILAPSGRGQLGVWPWWVPERARRIRELQGKGVPLDQVPITLEREAKATFEARETAAKTLVDQWLTPRSGADACVALLNRVGRKGRARRGIRNLRMSELFSVHVERAASDIGLPKRVAQRVGKVAAEREVLEPALTLFMQGYNPVLMWDGTRLHTLPDVLVPILFSYSWLRIRVAGYEAASQGRQSSKLTNETWPWTYVVINAWPLLRVLFPIGASENLPPMFNVPVYFPSLNVMSIDREDSPPMEYPFRLRSFGPHVADIAMSVLPQRGRPLPSFAELTSELSGKGAPDSTGGSKPVERVTRPRKAGRK